MQYRSKHSLLILGNGEEEDAMYRHVQEGGREIEGHSTRRKGAMERHAEGECRLFVDCEGMPWIPEAPFCPGKHLII